MGILTQIWTQGEKHCEAATIHDTGPRLVHVYAEMLRKEELDDELVPVLRSGRESGRVRLWQPQLINCGIHTASRHSSPHHLHFEEGRSSTTHHSMQKHTNNPQTLQGEG